MEYEADLKGYSLFFSDGNCRKIHTFARITRINFNKI